MDFAYDKEEQQEDDDDMKANFTFLLLLHVHPSTTHKGIPHDYERVALKLLSERAIRRNLKWRTWITVSFVSLSAQQLWLLAN